MCEFKLKFFEAVNS